MRVRAGREQERAGVFRAAVRFDTIVRGVFLTNRL